MNGLALIVIGLWLVGTGWHANISTAFSDAMTQTKFLPWIVAVVILWGLSQIDVLRGPVKAVMVLATVAVLLKQWPNIEKSIAALEQQGKTTQANNGATP